MNHSILQLGAVNSLRRRIIYFFAALIFLVGLLTVTGLFLMYDSSAMGESTPVLTGKSPIFFVSIFFVLITTLISCWLFLHRSILIPLEKLRYTLQRMTEGQLDLPLSIRSNNEVGQVGELVNDLSINIQEVLLYIWNYTQQQFSLLDRITKKIVLPATADQNLSVLNQDVGEMQRNAEELQAIVTAYDYFEVKLEQDKMVSDTQLEQPH